MGSPLALRFDPTDAARQLWQQVIEAGWWVLAGRAGIGVARLFIVLKDRLRETRILSDLLAGAITVATMLAIVTFAFSVPIGGLLATSGGIAVGLEKPYKAGDLLWVEGDIEGHVIQVNWRSTQIGTSDNNIAIVPNSIIAKARLVNRSTLMPQRNTSVEIKLNPHAIPEHCAATLTAAARACGTLLATPS